MEFELNIFSGFTSIGILRQIQKELKARQINPEQSWEKILFMSKFKDIDWTKKGNSLGLYFEFQGGR